MRNPDGGLIGIPAEKVEQFKNKRKEVEKDAYKESKKGKTSGMVIEKPE